MYKLHNRIVAFDYLEIAILSTTSELEDEAKQLRFLLHDRLWCTCQQLDESGINNELNMLSKYDE
jgi:hypothetical protein